MPVLIASCIFGVIHVIFLIVLVSKIKGIGETLTRMEILMQGQKEALGIIAYKSDEFVK